MLTKILLTTLVVCLVWWFATRANRPLISVSKKETLLTGQAVIRRYLLTMALALILLTGIGLGIWHVYDGYRPMTVTVISPMDGQSVSYQVRKKDIDGNQLLTLDGLSVRVSSQERMIISAN